MSDKATAMLTPKVQHPKRTKTFVSAIADALELFEDHIGSLDEDLRTNAYETLLTSYKDVLTSIWNLARSADVEMILKTITDKELTSFKDWPENCNHRHLQQRSQKKNEKSQIWKPYLQCSRSGAQVKTFQTMKSAHRLPMSSLN